MSEQFIEGRTVGSVYQLPRVKLLGKFWWIDERLKEFRSVEPPFECLSFDQMDDRLLEEGCEDSPDD